MTKINPEREQEFLRLHKAGLSDYRIAIKLNVVHGTVAKWRKRHGDLPANGKAPGCIQDVQPWCEHEAAANA
jgi:IS30 family transposase